MSEIKVDNKLIVKNTLFLYLRMGLTLVVSLFTTRVVIQSLGVEDYGINNVVAGFVSMFSFLNTTMANGVQRFYNFSISKNCEYSEKEVYNTALQIQLIITIVAILLLETVGIWYLYNKMVIPDNRLYAAMWVFQFSIASLLLVIMQIPFNAAIIAHEKMNFFAYVSIFDVLAKLFVAYALFICNGDRLVLYGFLIFCVHLVTFLLYYLYSKSHFKSLRFQICRNKTLFKSMLSFSGWNVFGTFAYMVKGQGLNMLLNVYFGPVVNAARGISNMIYSSIRGFQTNIVVAFKPQLTQSYALGDYNRVSILFYSLSKISYCLLAALIIPVLIQLEYILHLWLGESVPDYTYSFTWLILLNLMISALNTPISQIVQASGKMKKYQVPVSCIVCSILPISWFFLKLGYSPNAVYIVSLSLSVINHVSCMIILRSIFEYSIRHYLRFVILPLLFFSVAAPIIPGLINHYFNNTLISLVIITVVSLCSSVLCSYFIVLDKKEKQMVAKLLNKKLKRRI